MNSWLLLIILVFTLEAAVDWLADLLNLRNLSPELPREFIGVYDEERYAKSQHYLADSTRFRAFQQFCALSLLILFLVLGWFDRVDEIARGPGWGPIATGLFFIGILSAIRLVFALPFSAYATFVLEEEYGFNRTTPKTFVVDLVKSLLLSVLLGGPVVAALLYFFERTGAHAWLYAWIAFTAFSLLISFIAPVILMPLFNKFTPLAPSPLKTEIEDYARKTGFTLSGIFTMDGSKRSAKSNAFFTGFGRFRRLVLFDTLIENHSADELVAVVAHEVGHFKRKHIPKSLVLSIAITGLSFYALSLLIDNPTLFAAFKMSHVSVYASIVFISILASPVFKVVGVLTHVLSRKFEFEADEFSVSTFGQPETLVSALKKLSRDNLSNLTPHRLKVLLDYTHPPVLERIGAIRAIRAESQAARPTASRNS